MRTLITTIIATMVLGSASISLAKTFKLNTRDSSVKWTGAKVVGDSHTGMVKIKEGGFTEKDGKLTAMNVVVDMASISNTDLKDQKMNAKLVGHLKSDDFFSVVKFPTAKFESTKVLFVSGDKYVVHGNLTIKGKTKPLKIKANYTKGGRFESTFMFDRAEYDVRYGSGQFFASLGDKIIEDEIKIETNLRGN